MTTAQEFLSACAAEIGYTESPQGSNCNRYSKELGRGCERWCADFVVAMLRRNGIRLYSESAYTPTMANGFKAQGKWSASPAVGAAAFFDFPDSKYRIQHVGIVESWTADTITTTDGNTSSGPGGSEDNGGGVFRRTRPRKYVVGYGLIDYAQTTKPAPVPVIFKEDNLIRLPRPNVKLDSSGNGRIYLDPGMDSDKVVGVTFQDPNKSYTPKPPRWKRGNAADGAYVTLVDGDAGATYNVYVFVAQP